MAALILMAVGAVLVVAGVALFSIPVALVVAGVMCFSVGVFVDLLGGPDESDSSGA